ncbi:hypothetical protein D3C87_1765350 [compost metagenome]
MGESGIQPQAYLGLVGQKIGVGEDRTFGNARRSAGILQECDILRQEADRLQGKSLAFLQHGLEADGAGNSVGRHQFLHLANHKIDDMSLEAEEITHGCNDHMSDGGFRHRLLRHMGEILQYEKRF